MGSTSSKTGKKKSKQEDYVSWFEIPASNFDQAVRFYSQIFDIKMETMTNMGYAIAYFPESKGVGGAIVAGPGCIPSDTGTLVYLNGGEDLNEVLAKIESAGGRVVMGKTHISEEAGYFAIFIDTEGNKLALHSKN
jgi:predicted enzyme related to lactoylglutathione lyase